MTGSSDYDDARTRQVMAWIGAAFAAAGVLGYLLYPRLAIVWMVLVVFAMAAMVRMST